MTDGRENGAAARHRRVVLACDGVEAADDCKMARQASCDLHRPRRAPLELPLGMLERVKSVQVDLGHLRAWEAHVLLRSYAP